jgi:hypothetical protein
MTNFASTERSETFKTGPDKNILLLILPIDYTALHARTCPIIDKFAVKTQNEETLSSF